MARPHHPRPAAEGGPALSEAEGVSAGRPRRTPTRCALHATVSSSLRSSVGTAPPTLRCQKRAGAGCPPPCEECACIRYRGEPGRPFSGRGASVHCVPTLERRDEKGRVRAGSEERTEWTAWTRNQQIPFCQVHAVHFVHSVHSRRPQPGRLGFPGHRFVAPAHGLRVEHAFIRVHRCSSVVPTPLRVLGPGLSRPVRAGRMGSPIPRASPWAGPSQPFGLKTWGRGVFLSEPYPGSCLGFRLCCLSSLALLPLRETLFPVFSVCSVPPW